jgi:hypothetical protein
MGVKVGNEGMRLIYLRRMKPAALRSLLLIALILGSGLVLVGAIAKAQHWPVSNLLLGMGLILEVGCGIGLAIFSWRGRNGR